MYKHCLTNVTATGKEAHQANRKHWHNEQVKIMKTSEWLGIEVIMYLWIQRIRRETHVWNMTFDTPLHFAVIFHFTFCIYSMTPKRITHTHTQTHTPHSVSHTHTHPYTHTPIWFNSQDPRPRGRHDRVTGRHTQFTRSRVSTSRSWQTWTTKPVVYGRWRIGWSWYYLPFQGMFTRT